MRWGGGIKIKITCAYIPINIGTLESTTDHPIPIPHRRRGYYHWGNKATNTDKILAPEERTFDRTVYNDPMLVTRGTATGGGGERGGGGGGRGETVLSFDTLRDRVERNTRDIDQLRCCVTLNLSSLLLKNNKKSYRRRIGIQPTHTPTPGQGEGSNLSYI